MTRLNPISRLAVVVAVSLLSCGAAQASATWDLDRCVALGGNACKGTGDGTSINVTVKAFDANSGTDTFNSASFNHGNDAQGNPVWMGVKSKSSTGGTESTTDPHHSIDNYNGSGAGYAELVHLEFSSAVDLSQIVATWYKSTGDADFRIFRWNFNETIEDPNVGSFAPNHMPTTLNSNSNGWQLVASADFKDNLTHGIGDNTYYSSHWLISTAFSTSGNDAFKLGQVTASGVCVGGKTTGGNAPGGVCATTPDPSPAPEPASMALAGLALAGLAAQRRRRNRVAA